MTPAETLRAAADHVERVGLHQGGLYFAETGEYKDAPVTERPCCTFGALAVVTDAQRAGTLLDGEDSQHVEMGYPQFRDYADGLHTSPAAEAILAELSLRHPGLPYLSITRWSDSVAISATEVATVLRKAATATERP